MFSPATTAAIGSLGSLASGIGTLAGAFGKSGVDEGQIRGLNAINFEHQKDAERILRDQEFAQRLKFTEQEFAQKMQLAKTHGFHPLTMFGLPLSTAAPVSTYVSSGAPDTGPDLQSIGYGVKQVADSFVKPPEAPVDPLEQRAKEANVALLEAQAKRAEWQALQQEFETADYAAGRLLTGQPGSPPGVRTSNDVTAMQNLAAAQSGLSPSAIGGGGPTMKQDILPPHPVKLGYGAGTDQALVTTMDSTGKPGTVLNQGAIQAEFNDGATMTLLVKHFGVDRAVEIMSTLEQAGVVAGVGAALGAAGKMWYDRMAKQRADALYKRMHPRIYIHKPEPYKPQWRGRGRE